MAGAETPTVVLLPIKPEYAHPIMNGTKTVEFRKTVFAQTPTHVVVYASTPIKKVLGYFEVDAIEVDAVDSLWDRFAAVGGIDEADFRDYYAGREQGVAVGVERVVCLAEPLSLDALGLSGPPQSFMYVDHQVLQQFA